MKLLLDTHALLWCLSDDSRPGARARAYYPLQRTAAISDTQNVICPIAVHRT
jgi:PIN domain nuclease of toxin-antitoxin system